MHTSTSYFPLYVIDNSEQWMKKIERRENINLSLHDMNVFDMNTGSAKNLRGTISVGHIFLSVKHKRKWNSIKRKKVRAKTKNALDWLKREAAPYSISIHFIETEFPEIAISLNKDSEDTKMFLREKLVSQYSNLIDSLPDAKEKCFIVHLRDDFEEIGFACPAFTGIGHPKLEGDVEFCFVGEHAAEAVYAHELLHLFGADDEYHIPKTLMNEEIADQYYHWKKSFLKRSIMFYGDRPLSDLRVGKTTAQLIGWC